MLAHQERPPIRRLDETTVSRIAAGEVVERPASVVKELYENALDSGAHEIWVRWSNGGLDLIEVADDGEGIMPSELPLAVERHATSKLANADGLHGISTLGFRGEALASIGAVARMRVISRPVGESMAHGWSIVGGVPAGRFVAGRSVGTTVSVEELFFNVPARRKFLHAPVVEQVEILATIDRLYLARPPVALVAMAEGREILRYPPSVSLTDAAGRIFGAEFLDHSFTMTEEGPCLRVEAVLSRPNLSRSTAGSLALSVNGRSVQSRLLSQAVRQAYHGYLPRGRFSFGVLHLKLPPENVDVNVHPTKREVRISSEREVGDQLRRWVRAALQRSPHVADSVRSPVRGQGAQSTPVSATAPSAVEVQFQGGAGSGFSGQRTLFEGVEAPQARIRGTERHPELKLLGSVFGLYWVAESEDAGLVLVDQHAASERVLFDLLRRSGRLARQELLSPVRFVLSARQVSTWKSQEEAVSAAGYELEAFGGEAYRLRTVPSYRGRTARAEGFPALLDELAEDASESPTPDWTERRAATLACHAAVRAGDSLAPEEMGRILEALYHGPEEAYACPHGRPILVSFSRSHLDRLFLRKRP